MREEVAAPERRGGSASRQFAFSDESRDAVLTMLVWEPSKPSDVVMALISETVGLVFLLQRRISSGSRLTSQERRVSFEAAAG